MRIEQEIFLDLLQKTGLNQSQFAAKRGCFPANIQQYCRGSRHMPIEKLRKTADDFGLKLTVNFKLSRNK
ncbi:MAG: hypothetical protein V6Z82_03495 [Flavobacteriales bacterium]